MASLSARCLSNNAASASRIGTPIGRAATGSASQGAAPLPAPAAPSVKLQREALRSRTRARGRSGSGPCDPEGRQHAEVALRRLDDVGEHDRLGALQAVHLHVTRSSGVERCPGRDTPDQA